MWAYWLWFMAFRWCDGLHASGTWTPPWQTGRRFNRCVGPRDSHSWDWGCHVFKWKKVNLKSDRPQGILYSSINTKSVPPPPPAPHVYLCSSSRATQNLTQYILVAKWNKEVCLQPGLGGGRPLDVFQGLAPASPFVTPLLLLFRCPRWHRAGSALTVWRLVQASHDTNAKNMRRVEKQKPWPLAEWHSPNPPLTEVLGT